MEPKLELKITMKFFLLHTFLIFSLYLIDIVVVNNPPSFFACFCGSCTYIYSLARIESCKKMMANFIDKGNSILDKHDIINLIWVLFLTILFTVLIYIYMSNGLTCNTDIGHSFWSTAIIFLIMTFVKIPKRFFY